MYEWAVKLIDKLMEFDPELGTPESRYLDALVWVVEEYEKHGYIEVQDMRSLDEMAN